MKVLNPKYWMGAVMSAATLAMVAGGTGCQISVGGQTLPSPYYIDDDVQYFAPGPEFKLSREAAAQKQFDAEQQLQAIGGGGGGAGFGAAGIPAAPPPAAP